MTTTGTFAFAPGTGEILLNAFGRIGIEPTALTTNHMLKARFEANLMQVEWSNRGPNLWAVDLATVPLIAGQATYTVGPETVMILDAYISGLGSDRIILPVSRTTYASYPDKTTQGVPTSFWFDRLIAPTISLWPVPSQSGIYSLKYYRFRQIQDAAIAGGSQPEIPYLWLDAMTAGMAHRLSRHFARPVEAMRKADYDEAYKFASDQNTENAPLYVTPMLGSYYT